MDVKHWIFVPWGESVIVSTKRCYCGREAQDNCTVRRENVIVSTKRYYSGREALDICTVRRECVWCVRLTTVFYILYFPYARIMKQRKLIRTACASSKSRLQILEQKFKHKINHKIRENQSSNKINFYM